MLNVKLLKSKMILFGDESFIKAISQLLEITRQTAAAKLDGNSEFTQTEIATIAKHYALTDEDIRKIFIEGDNKE